MERLVYDLRYAVRQLWRTPMFTVAVVATVALAVGANTLLFAIANASIFRRLPYPDSSRIVSMSIVQKGRDIARFDEPTARLAVAAKLPAFESLGLYNTAGATVTAGEYPERLPGARVSAAFFNVFGMQPALGRAFTEDDTRAGGPRLIVLSDAMWARLFGRRSAIVGRPVTLDDNAYEVVGVMPAGFSYPGRTEFWLPLVPRQLASGLYYIDFVGRLHRGVTTEQAQAALASLRESHKNELPAAALRSETRLVSLHQRLYGDFRRPLLLLLGTVGCVLLIGCANIANLLLARGSSRGRELAVRLAVGASRGRLFRQLLVESILLACLGAVPGIGLAFLGLQAFRAFGPPALARLATLTIDGQVLLFTLALTICTGLIFGLAPAVAATREDPQEGLRAGRGALGHGGRSRPRRALVVLEIAAAVVLTLGAALLAKSFSRFQSIDRGFDAANVLTASMTLPTTRYADAGSRRAFFDNLQRRLHALPGVEVVSVSDTGLSGLSMTMTWPPAKERGAESWEIAIADGIGPDHFRTFGIPIVEGRECGGAADASAVVINRAMARRSYGDRSALGAQLNLGEVSSGTRTVVGVAADVPDIRTKAAPIPTVYTCAGAERSGFATIALRAAPGALLPPFATELRSAVRAIDPALPLGRVVTVEEMVRDGMSSRWFDATVIAALSMLALLLALGGLYAVTAHQVAQRTREIGVRMALGADRTSVLTMVLRQGGALVLAGTCLGMLAAIPLVRFVASMLFDVQPLDASVFAAVAAMVGSVAMAATLIPARRASLIEPISALRAE